MSVSITRIVKFIRKGEKGDKGENGITISLLPAALTPKVGVSSTLRVQVALYDGGRLIGYNDETDGNMLCSILPTSSAYKWTFRVESGKFYFLIMLTPTDTTAISLPFTITYKGAKYDSVITIQPVADGQDGARGDRGPALRGPQAWSDCAVGYVFQSGANGEEYKDIVLYGGYYYSCIKSHTKTASNNPGSATDTNSGLWKSADKLEMVATKILLAQYALVKNLGVETIDMKDADGNIIFQAKDGNVTCNSGTFKNGTFTNVKVIGSIRNPFNLANSSFDVDYSDNVAMLSSDGGWLDAYSMPWDVSQSGRRLTIVNYKWGNTLAYGKAGISAPSGKYFFEDGIQKSQLKISREIIEMIGYGSTTEFYGWIVLNRIDLVTSQKYGHCLKALAVGTVSGGNSNDNTSITSNTFDGSKLTVYRQSEGLYRVYYPSAWFSYSSNCRVILTGRGVCYGGISPVKATLHSLDSGYFDVTTSDDATLNDGSFDFIIYNGSDFDILK